MLNIIIIISILVIYLGCLIYINQKSLDLILAIRKIPELDKKAGHPSNDYFFLDFLIMMKYSFAIFLWRNKEMPNELDFDPELYKLVRDLSNIAIVFELAIIFIVIITLTITNWL
ncbi:hypothetical protein [Aggregatibacter kilianii]|uniref:hypothetical protein n=1 Tax=Aggregatibacter kilianii TaxID=2025884 RepID=UPI000D659F19|nr:hypothetical protein [Aggregatibacter kilianii]